MKRAVTLVSLFFAIVGALCRKLWNLRLPQPNTASFNVTGVISRLSILEVPRHVQRDLGRSTHFCDVDSRRPAAGPRQFGCGDKGDRHISCGGRHEGQGETGVAHLLEHMLFRGTDLPRELARRGARYNATTTEDYTSYYETFPASDDNLAWALEVEADRMVNGALRAEHLPAERSVVLREIDRAESEPFRVLLERTSAAAYAWHRRPIR